MSESSKSSESDLSRSGPALAWLIAWPVLAIAIGFPITEARFAMKIMLAAALLVWAWANRERPERIFAPGIPWLPVLLSLSAIAFYAGMGILLYANYSEYGWGDIGAYLGAFRTSDSWLPGINNLDGLPHLAHHSEFFMIPLGWLYKAAPWPATVQLAQAACSLIAWILFRSWLLKRMEDKGAAEWIAFGFALTTCVVAALLRGFHGSGLAIPALALTATAYHDREWRKFLLGLFLLLMMKEVFTVSAMTLGAFALLQRRGAKWVCIPFLMGLGYGLLLRFWFFPMMLPHGAYFYSSVLPDARGILAHVFSLPSLLYLFQIALWGGGVWAFRSPYLLLAIPPLLLNLVLGFGYNDHRRHYSIEPAFWAFFAGATVLMEGKVPRKKLFSFLSVLILMNAALLQSVPFRLRHPLAASYREVLDRLPTDAIVARGVDLDDQLWKIGRFYMVKYGGYGGKEPCTWARLLSLEGKPGEYVIVRNRIGVEYFAPEEKDHFAACWDELRKDPAYAAVWEDSALVLLKRNP